VRLRARDSARLPSCFADREVLEPPFGPELGDKPEPALSSFLGDEKAVAAQFLIGMES
jgi:hypothetical protein